MQTHKIELEPVQTNLEKQYFQFFHTHLKIKNYYLNDYEEILKIFDYINQLQTNDIKLYQLAQKTLNTVIIPAVTLFIQETDSSKECSQIAALLTDLSFKFKDRGETLHIQEALQRTFEKIYAKRYQHSISLNISAYIIQAILFLANDPEQLTQLQHNLLTFLLKNCSEQLKNPERVDLNAVTTLHRRIANLYYRLNKFSCLNSFPKLAELLQLIMNYEHSHLLDKECETGHIRLIMTALLKQDFNPETQNEFYQLLLSKIDFFTQIKKLDAREIFVILTTLAEWFSKIDNKEKNHYRLIFIELLKKLNELSFQENYNRFANICRNFSTIKKIRDAIPQENHYLCDKLIFKLSYQGNLHFFDKTLRPQINISDICNAFTTISASELYTSEEYSPETEKICLSFINNISDHLNTIFTNNTLSIDATDSRLRLNLLSCLTPLNGLSRLSEYGIIEINPNAQKKAQNKYLELVHLLLGTLNSVWRKFPLSSIDAGHINILLNTIVRLKFSYWHTLKLRSEKIICGKLIHQVLNTLANLLNQKNNINISLETCTGILHALAFLNFSPKYKINSEFTINTILENLYQKQKEHLSITRKQATIPFETHFTLSLITLAKFDLLGSNHDPYIQEVIAYTTENLKKLAEKPDFTVGFLWAMMMINFDRPKDKKILLPPKLKSDLYEIIFSYKHFLNQSSQQQLFQLWSYETDKQEKFNLKKITTVAKAPSIDIYSPFEDEAFHAFTLNPQINKDNLHPSYYDEESAHSIDLAYIDITKNIRIAIEVDRLDHFLTTNATELQLDFSDENLSKKTRFRDHCLRKSGWRVLSIRNKNDLKNPQKLCEILLETIAAENRLKSTENPWKKPNTTTSATTSAAASATSLPTTTTEGKQSKIKPDILQNSRQLQAASQIASKVATAPEKLPSAKPKTPPPSSNNTNYWGRESTGSATLNTMNTSSLLKIMEDQQKQNAASTAATPNTSHTATATKTEKSGKIRKRRPRTETPTISKSENMNLPTSTIPIAADTKTQVQELSPSQNTSTLINAIDPTITSTLNTGNPSSALTPSTPSATITTMPPNPPPLSSWQNAQKNSVTQQSKQKAEETTRGNSNKKSNCCERSKEIVTSCTLF